MPPSSPLPELTERPLIKTDADLQALCEELHAAGRFALDTEFLGERTYVPRLCLVQIATAEFIALVDTLAVRDLGPLWELVADPDVEVVLHAAREDLRLAYYGGGRRLPAHVFDTQVAAGLVGLPFYPISYARLVEAVMGVRLSKGETRSEWDRRPLSPEQVAYARDDVRYLLPLADKLGGLLARLGRGEWMREEMTRYAVPGVYEPDPELAYLRLRGAKTGLSRRPTALLRAVTAWREREAAARDVTARMVLSDEALIMLALRPPRRLSDFVRLKGFPPGEEVAMGPGLLDALNAGRAVPDDDLPLPLAGASSDETPQERASADLLYALGVSLCLARDMAPEIVLAKADALALARGATVTPLLTGWRRAALGNELAQIASGAAAVSVTMTPTGPSVTLSPLGRGNSETP